MARQFGQRLKLLYVLEILKTESDENYPITAEYICECLEKKGITAERKSIYGDISALSEYGYDIIKSSYPRGWFLGERDFEEPEVFILADAVRTAKFISVAETRKLLKKLEANFSRHKTLNNEERVYFSAAKKCDNGEILYSIDKISTAISNKRKIEFDYVSRVLNYDCTVEKEVKHMKVSPYALVWRDDHYYVIGNYEKYDNLIHLRLDRMYKVEETSENSRSYTEVSDYKFYFDASDYTERLFSMHGGKLTEITLSCNRKIIEQVIDRFGDKIYIKDENDEEFSFAVKVAISDALVTWILNYGDKIKVLAPTDLKDMVKQRAQEVLKLYE